MRAILLILILAVVVLIVAIATGFLDINQIRGAKAPDIDASRNGVTATGGQAPAFDIETGSVAVGTRRSQCRGPDARGEAARTIRRADPEPDRAGDQQRHVADRRGVAALAAGHELSHCRRRCAGRSTLPREAAAAGEVPVGAVVTRGDEILAEARNAMRGSSTRPPMPKSSRSAQAATKLGTAAARRMHLVGDARAVRDVRRGDRRWPGSRRCASPPKTRRAAAWSTARGSSRNRPAIIVPTCSAGSAKPKPPRSCGNSSRHGARRRLNRRCSLSSGADWRLGSRNAHERPHSPISLARRRPHPRAGRPQRRSVDERAGDRLVARGAA